MKLLLEIRYFLKRYPEFIKSGQFTYSVLQNTHSEILLAGLRWGDWQSSILKKSLSIYQLVFCSFM